MTQLKYCTQAKICFILLLAMTTVGTSGCINKESSTQELAIKIAKLHPLELETVDSYEKFKDIAGNFNDLIRLLNKEGGYNIQELDVTVENYQKISRILTEYGPLINNYNEVVKSAQEYDGTTEKTQAFYNAIGNFTLETFLITTAAFGTFSYESVGVLYRASGLNIVAPSCPTCVSIILGNAHWFLRTYMVEKSPEAARRAEQILSQIELSDEIKSIKQKSQDVANNAINRTNEMLSSWNNSSWHIPATQ